MVGVDRALLSVTVNASVASAPSSTSASATESTAGPAVLTESPPASLRPSAVHTPGAVSHALVPLTRTVTSPRPAGRIRRVQPLFFPGLSRLAFSMRPPVTAKSPFWTVR